jgi:hypothetical protein
MPLFLPDLREDKVRTETTNRVSEVAQYPQTTAILRESRSPAVEVEVKAYPTRGLL